MVEKYLLGVKDDDREERLDVFLTRNLVPWSRAHVQKFIKENLVMVNGQPLKANYKVQAGDQIVVTVPAVKDAEVAAEDIPLNILYEDSDIIVVNKSRGMVVHPAAGNYHGTLVNALLNHCKDLSGINGVSRPGIVHRLDKDTSGVMVAAKTDRAHLELARQIKEHTASRIYLALVFGRLPENAGIIDAPIGRHPGDRKKMAVTFTHSKPAITKFKVVEQLGNYTLVKCQILTGRTHQIRVHMTYIGHPLVGDPKYGPGSSPFKISGQALHSAQLKLVHPVSGELMIFVASLPVDMRQGLTELRSGLK